MEKTMRFLEFEKIRQQLQTFTMTIPGTQKASFLKPHFSLQEVNELQRETTEARQMILQKKLPLKGCGDLMPSLRRAEKGGALNPAELTEILFFLQSIGALKTFFLENDLRQTFPLIFQLIDQVHPLVALKQELERCLTPHGELHDHASPLLRSLRQEVKKLQNKIRESLESYLRSPQYKKYLQENIITLRSNRYVLPIKQEFRNQLPGIVHDQSASGMTLFVEPFQVVELNNRLKAVGGRLEDEIKKILQRLTARLAAHSNEISFNYNLYGELDFILAKGYLSLALKGREPLLNEEGYLRINGGRHPLLPPSKVVPLDVYLGGDFQTLVITGPNTGGKTVALKTIGLFCLMSQCGLHLPVGEGTELSVFEGIWADIGDEQDIEQSLSTFSGHMMNIIEILHQARPLSLVLLDELGAGTDPSEGSALAMAILDELHARGTRTIATTHINELKIFAHMRAGMENASMEFDLETLSPTFRLLIGVPGQSNALAIAERLGLPTEMVSKARTFMRKEFLNLEEVVSGLVEERRRFSQDSEKIEEIKAELNDRLQKVEEEYNDLQHKKAEILNKARQETGEILRRTRRKADGILKKLHRAEREGRGKQSLSLGEEARLELKDLQEESSRQNFWGNEPALESLDLKDIKEEQPVYIKSLRCRGKITSITSEEEIQVQVGPLKINTALADLQASRGEGNKRKDKFQQNDYARRKHDILWEKSTTVRPSIDLRGLIMEEAILKVEKHLDDALLVGLDRIELIHGKGTGKLRQGLHYYLDDHNLVESYRLGVEGEGGSGVTIVSLKKS
jgi:DNA mismatch repair protein MutS2